MKPLAEPLELTTVLVQNRIGISMNYHFQHEAHRSRLSMPHLVRRRQACGTLHGQIRHHRCEGNRQQQKVTGTLHQMRSRLREMLA